MVVAKHQQRKRCPLLFDMTKFKQFHTGEGVRKVDDVEENHRTVAIISHGHGHGRKSVSFKILLETDIRSVMRFDLWVVNSRWNAWRGRWNTCKHDQDLYMRLLIGVLRGVGNEFSEQ